MRISADLCSHTDVEKHTRKDKSQVGVDTSKYVMMNRLE